MNPEDKNLVGAASDKMLEHVFECHDAIRQLRQKLQAMNDPTPFERLQADNDDLRARLQLADERAFDQSATIARLRAEIDQMKRDGDAS